ncbi:RNA polymerase sigma-70 factor [Segatella baroniae F0067]|uniref:RNA polymerase sigma-70 factor n=2 Tax=Segatella baroniae TaxID=305719 RepID=U2QJ74_9BACT|nr:RNA polymerase sigma-70 factor [Segatella baroniae]ERK38867.1 RNA polymerase sigma-70 factor [Segatella baroniae F0067]
MMHVYSDNNLLIADIRNGKHEAYEYLFATYYPRLHNYALRFLANGDAVGDIIQDCFMKLWEKRGELILQSVGALLFRMVRNQCLNYLRHKALEDSEWLQSLNLEDHSERLYSTDFLDDPDQELLFQELKRQVEQTLDALPERSRQIFTMSRFDGMKNREIAEELGISVKVVERHIGRALKMFRRQLRNVQPLDVRLILMAWLMQSGSW